MRSGNRARGGWKRRHFGLLALALALVSGAGLYVSGIVGGAPSESCPERERRAPAERLNVVVVMTDDQEVGSLGVMRHVKRELRREGTTFKKFFATFPLCCPSRTTFLTGQYPHNHGVLGNRPPEGGYERFDPEETLPVSLECEGYRTGYIGKLLNGYGQRGNDPREVPEGWTDWFVNTEGGYFDYVMNRDGSLRRFGDDERDYRTDVEARAAERFIRDSARGDQPFFLVFATQAPHTERGAGRPLRPAPRHDGRFSGERLPRPPSFNEENVSDKPAFVRERKDKDPRGLRQEYRDRLRSLLAVDEAVERIDRTLEDTGQFDRTLVIYTSDNGYFVGEHRLAGKTKHGALYDEATRVPLIMRGPGIPRGEVRRKIAGNIDLAPTILEVTGAAAGRRLDGLSLIPLVHDEYDGVRRDILLEDVEAKAVRTPRYMYARHPNGETELYDMRRDPHQLRSRHDDPSYRKVRQRLRERLQNLENCAGPECR